MQKRILFIFLIGFVAFHARTQNCGAVQNLSTAQLNQLTALFPQFEAALALENLQLIDSLSREIKIRYGSEAGIPDQLEDYTTLINTNTWLDLNNSLALSRQLIAPDSLAYVDLWKLGKGLRPPSYQPHSIFLRAAAQQAVGLLKIAHFETDLTRKSLYESWAIRTLDSLSTMQLPSGAFPFPDLRTYNDPVFSSIIQNFLLSCGPDSVNVLQNGWIIDDRGTGEFKFDAGVIANAYYEAFYYTGLDRFKNTAISIGNYLRSLALNSNFNYNSFVSLGLTRAYQLTNDASYLDRAFENMRLGIYPGQIDNGRWMDGHNARSVYHAIMIRNCAPSYAYLPTNHAYRQQLDSMIYRAVKNLLDYSYTCDAATGFQWLIQSYQLESDLISAGMRDSIANLIGRHINEAADSGSFLDLPVLGDYLELLQAGTNELKSIVDALDVKVFPNPCSAAVHVSFGMEIPDELYISDLSGKIHRLKFVKSSNQTEALYTIDLTEFQPGIYLLELQFGNYNRRIKLIHY